MEVIKTLEATGAVSLAAVGTSIESYISSGGYLGLALLVLLENIVPPIPSEVILPLAGSYVAAGQLVFVWAVVAATAGSVAGALLIYGIAKAGGRPLLHRWGGIIGLDAKHIQKADDWFDRHGAAAVLLGRLVPGVRSVISVPAGLASMPLRQFMLLTTIGSGVWNTALIAAGWALGRRWRAASDVVAATTPYLLGALLLLSVGYISWRIFHHRRHR